MVGSVAAAGFAAAALSDDEDGKAAAGVVDTLTSVLSDSHCSQPPATALIVMSCGGIPSNTIFF